MTDKNTKLPPMAHAIRLFMKEMEFPPEPALGPSPNIAYAAVIQALFNSVRGMKVGDTEVTCDPSLQQIADICHCNPRSIRRLLKKLKEHGVISIKTHGAHLSSTYTVHKRIRQDNHVPSDSESRQDNPESRQDNSRVPDRTTTPPDRTCMSSSGVNPLGKPSQDKTSLEKKSGKPSKSRPSFYSESNAEPQPPQPPRPSTADNDSAVDLPEQVTANTNGCDLLNGSSPETNDGDPIPVPLVCGNCGTLTNGEGCYECGSTEVVQMSKPTMSREEGRRQYLSSGENGDLAICPMCNRCSINDQICDSGDGGIPMEASEWQVRFVALWDAWDTYTKATNARNAPKPKDIVGKLDVEVMHKQADIIRFRQQLFDRYKTVVDKRQHAKELFDSGNKWKIRQAWYAWATGGLDDDSGGDDGRIDDVVDGTMPWDFDLFQKLDDLQGVPLRRQVWMRPKDDDPKSLKTARLQALNHGGRKL